MAVPSFPSVLPSPGEHVRGPAIGTGFLDFAVTPCSLDGRPYAVTLLKILGFLCMKKNGNFNSARTAAVFLGEVFWFSVLRRSRLSLFRHGCFGFRFSGDQGSTYALVLWSLAELFLVDFSLCNLFYL